MPQQGDRVQVPDELAEAAEQNVSRLLERGFELYDVTGDRLRFAPDSALARCAVMAVLQATLPSIEAACRERFEEDLLGSGAIALLAIALEEHGGGAAPSPTARRAILKDLLDGLRGKDGAPDA